MINIASFLQRNQEHEYAFFWQHSENSPYVTKACLSQWYPSSFFDEGQFYNCAEQYMMAQKARLMGDKKVQEEIMKQTDPKVIKALGKTVKPFNKDLWEKYKVDIVLKGNKLKFSQNPILGNYLLSTGNKVLVEASPYDEIWGIAMKETDPGVKDPFQWKGRNLLGFILMEVRDWLRVEEEKEKQKSLQPVKCSVTPDKIDALKENEIFVFGSDLGGNHAGGTAAIAFKKFGAIWGVGAGIQGKSYAIPTMLGSLKKLRAYVDQFIEFAKHNPRLQFLVTKIGCGKAGYKIEEIAPLFSEAVSLSNVSLPQDFINIIQPQFIQPQSKEFSKEAKNIVFGWSMGLGNSAKALMGLDPMPSKKIIATAQTWKDIRPMPKEHSTITLDYTIPTLAMKILLKGHIPDAMEDHWFMYCDKTTIRYYRSWTGICIYVAHYEIKGDKTLITTLEINRDREQYLATDDNKDRNIFLYLITTEYGGDPTKIWDLVSDK